MLFLLFFIGFPIQYSNRPGAAKFQGASDSTFPIKLNSASVIPVIFASTLMSIPTTIVSLLGLTDTTKYAATTGAYKLGYWLNQIFNTTSTVDGKTTINVIGFILYIVLIILFSFFYSFLQIDPDKMADNLKKQNAYIPGYKPGEETADFISRVLFKVTLLGATYLAILASLPIIFTWVFKLSSNVSIGGTSIMIVVGVAIETVKQIKQESEKQEYHGFL